jgi:hypothetical protein
VVIFINGPFGVGKTSVANELHKRLPNSLVYDPEEVGSLLSKILGKYDPKPDFQEYSLWPTLVVEVAANLRREYGRDLIIPMTLYDAGRFKFIAEGLTGIDPDLHHFCLLAPEATILARIGDRSDEGIRWCKDHLLPSLEAFDSVQFDHRIHTDKLDVNEIADLIIGRIKK